MLRAHFQVSEAECDAILARDRSTGNLHALFEVAGAGNGVIRPPRQPSTLPGESECFRLAL